MAGVVRRHAVNVVWTFAGTTTLDWDCGDSVQCVLDNYETFFSGGRSGIPLMHAVIGGTAGAAPEPVCTYTRALDQGLSRGVNSTPDYCQLMSWHNRIDCASGAWY